MEKYIGFNVQHKVKETFFIIHILGDEGLLLFKTIQSLELLFSLLTESF